MEWSATRRPAPPRAGPHCCHTSCGLQVSTGGVWSARSPELNAGKGIWLMRFVVVNEEQHWSGTQRTVMGQKASLPAWLGSGGQTRASWEHLILLTLSFLPSLSFLFPHHQIGPDLQPGAHLHMPPRHIIALSRERLRGAPVREDWAGLAGLAALAAPCAA